MRDIPVAGDPALEPVCTSCHSTQGFVSWMRRGVLAGTAPTADAAEPQSCIACHDPHGESLRPDGTPTPHLLRRFGAVVTLAGPRASGVGAGAVCMICHNGVNSFDPVSQLAPHAGTQADVLLAKSAATFAEGSYPTSAHVGAPSTCVACHMAPLPTPDAAVGGPTVMMRDAATGRVTASGRSGGHVIDLALDPGLVTNTRGA